MRRQLGPLFELHIIQTEGPFRTVRAHTVRGSLNFHRRCKKGRNSNSDPNRTWYKVRPAFPLVFFANRRRDVRRDMPPCQMVWSARRRAAPRPLCLFVSGGVCCRGSRAERFISGPSRNAVAVGGARALLPFGSLAPRFFRMITQYKTEPVSPRVNTTVVCWKDSILHA